MKRLVTIAFALAAMASCCPKPEADLTVIPPGKVSSKIDLDVRFSVRDLASSGRKFRVGIYAGDSLVYSPEAGRIPRGEFLTGRISIPAAALMDRDGLRLEVFSGKKKLAVREEVVKVIPSDIRSTRAIDGAYIGITHWSDLEGKNWNPAQRKMTDAQWKEMICSMHKLGMDIIVIQDLFHCKNRAARHHDTVESYPGLAYYPSDLYPGRMEMTAVHPVEVIFSVADSLGMKVIPGIGNFARFDFSEESLEWHRRVAREVWEKYGHHNSFYGFYVSEESCGSLDLRERSKEKRDFRKQEIVDFFRGFRQFIDTLAPAKPTMFSTNSFGVPSAMDTYPRLMEHLDILCPFGFARMPAKDISGKECADLLQAVCDEKGAHLWFDLEAFLFNDDRSLYPRDIEGIVADLTLLDNFEKVICYQYPGVFSDPESDFLVGEEKTLKLFKDYNSYLLSIQ